MQKLIKLLSSINYSVFSPICKEEQTDHHLFCILKQFNFSFKQRKPKEVTECIFLWIRQAPGSPLGSNSSWTGRKISFHILF